jgi:hypothetical protein
MGLETNIILYIAAGISILFGLLLRRWAGQNDLVGVVTDSAWQLARGKRRGGQVTDIEERIAGITSAPTAAGKVRRATGSVIGHLLSATAGLAGLVLILTGMQWQQPDIFTFPRA